MALALTLGLPGSAAAASPAERYPETLAPPRSRQIELNTLVLAEGETPEVAELSRDPRLLTAWLAANPQKLRAETMDPGILLSIAQLLQGAGRVFEAERLLHQGLKLWPDNLDLAKRWAGLVLGMNRAEAAREVLERAAPQANDALTWYMLGQAYLRRDPRSVGDTRAVVAAWERTLALAPDFRDATGTDANDLRGSLEKLRAELPAEPVAPGPESAPGAASAAPATAP